MYTFSLTCNRGVLRRHESHVRPQFFLTCGTCSGAQPKMFARDFSPIKSACQWTVRMKTSPMRIVCNCIPRSITALCNIFTLPPQRNMLSLDYYFPYHRLFVRVYLLAKTHPLIGFEPMPRVSIVRIPSFRHWRIAIQVYEHVSWLSPRQRSFSEWRGWDKKRKEKSWGLILALLPNIWLYGLIYT